MPPQAPMGAPRPQVDMSNLPLADIIAAVSALLFVIFTGIGWYELGAKGAMGGIDLAVGIIALLFAVVMIANNYLNFIPTELPSGVIYLGAAGVALLFLFLGLVVRPETIEWPIRWAIWTLSIIFALGIGAGGFLKVQQG